MYLQFTVSPRKQSEPAFLLKRKSCLKNDFRYKHSLHAASCVSRADIKSSCVSSVKHRIHLCLLRQGYFDLAQHRNTSSEYLRISIIVCSLRIGEQLWTNTVTVFFLSKQLFDGGLDPCVLRSDQLRGVSLNL